MNNNKNYTLFCALKRAERTKEQIMEAMGISKTTYYEYLNKFVDESDHSLTPANYYKQIRKRIGNKSELAECFKTTRPTLNRYESLWDAHARISRAMYILSHRDAKGIAYLLHVDKQADLAKIDKHIKGLPKLRHIVENLDTVIDVLRDFAEFDPDVARKIKTLEDVKNTINNCIEIEVIGIEPIYAADRTISNDIARNDSAVPDMEETDTEEKKVIPPFKIDIERELKKIGKRKRK